MSEMSEMNEYVSMSVLVPRESKNQFSKKIIANGLIKQQHFLANLVVWASLDETRIRLAHRWFRYVHVRGQLCDTCISTPRIKRFERDIFKSKVLGLGYKNREILIGLVQMIVKRPKLINEIATFRVDDFKRKV